MDQVKIGKFLSDERKAKGYTQKQLSELLGISDKTISKWECGNGFPEASLLLPLCNELEITVNELLTGERISQQNYKKKAEENMVNINNNDWCNINNYVCDITISGLFLHRCDYITN